jgi:hypothetical protein
VAQGEGPKFKPQYCKKRKKNKLIKISDRENIETDIFFQMFKELMTIFHKIFQKKERKKHFTAHSMRLVLSEFQNQRKHIKIKLQISILCEYRCKYIQHNTGTATYKSYTP